MTAIVEIPLSPTPQRFTITLGARELDLRFAYANVAEGGWIMDIADARTSRPLICGVPLVTGADLLEQFRDLALGAMFVGTDGAPDVAPTFANLGSSSHLYFADI